MTRRLLIQIHLYLAAFMAPVFILLSISGGLYLIGQKGATSSSAVTLPSSASLDFKSETLDADLRALLKEAGIDHDFDYIKNRGNLIQTRPTSRAYYQLTHKDGALTADYKEPNFQAAMMELHKGHGPSLFKTYQKLVALGLFFVVLSGFWLGITSKALRKSTALLSVAGLVVFLWLALLA